MSGGLIPLVSAHIPDILDVLMLSLRTADGIDVQQFSQRYGSSATSKLVAAVSPYVQRGIALAHDSEGNRLQHEQLQAAYCDGADTGLLPGKIVCGAGGLGSLRLSDPQGFLISNEVISTLFAKFS